MQPKNVKRIFLFFIFYLPLQYAIVGVVGYYYSEPWPAFILPGFKSVYETEGVVEIEEVSFFAIPDDGQNAIIEVAPDQLFKGLPASQLQGFLRSNFTGEQSFSREAKQWFREQLNRLHPGGSFSSLQIQWRELTYHQDNNSVNIINRETIQIMNISLGTE